MLHIPAIAIAISIHSGSPGNIFTVTESPKLEIKVTNQSDVPAEVPINYRALDLYDRTILSGEITVSVPGKEKHTITVMIPEGWTGWGRLEAGIKCVTEASASFAVLPNREVVSRSSREAIDSPFGMGVYFDRFPDDQIDAVGRIAQLAGVRWVREDMSWPSVQPERGKFHWERYDRDAKAARKWGINLLGLIGYLPDWARVEGTNGNRPPKEIKDWEAFVEAAATRYRDDIRAWEIWNEPDVGTHEKPFFFTGVGSEYVPILQSAYRTIKRVAPEHAVLNGGYSLCFAECQDMNRQTLDLGAADFFDVFCLHGYSGVPRELAEWRLVFEHGASKKAWDTENGCPTHEKGASEREQASALIKNYITRIGSGFSKVFCYNFRDDGWNREDPEHCYGVLHHDLTPKPAYVAYAVMTRMLDGAKFLSTLDMPRGLHAHVFARGKSPVVVAWSDAGGTACELPFTTEKLTLTDLMGHSRQVTGELHLDREPVFIQGDEGDGILDVASFTLELAGIPRLPGDKVKFYPEEDIRLLVKGADGKVEVSVPEWMDVKKADHDERVSYLLTLNTSAQHGDMGEIIVSSARGARRISVQVWAPSEASEQVIETRFLPLARPVEENPSLVCRLTNTGKEKLSGTVSLVLPSSWRALPSEANFSDLQSGGSVDLVFQLGLGSGLPKEAYERAVRNGYRIGVKTLLSDGRELSSSIPLDIAIASRAPEGMRMDCDLEKWQNAYPINISQAHQVYFGRNLWAGEKDLSLASYLMWDEECLYFAAVVQDDVIRKNVREYDAWAGDACLQLCFDTDIEGDCGEKKHSDDDYEFFLIFDDSGTPRLISVAGPNEIEGVSSACKRIPGGYVVEAAIPVSNFPKLPTGPGKSFGFSLAVSDADGTMDHEKAASFSGDGDGWSDPTTYIEVHCR